LSVKGTRWRQHRSPLLGIFSLGGPQLGNPSIENDEQVRAVRDFLATENQTIDPTGAIVFLADNVEVEIDDTPISVVHVTELHEFLLESGGEVTLGGKERDQLVELLSRGEQMERNVEKGTRPKKKVRAA
jgi:hypothetical protein